MININDKSNELKIIVSKYEKKSFIGFFSYLIRQQNTNIIENLFESKLKDFLYLIGLRLFNKIEGGSEFIPSRDLLVDLDNRLKEIKEAYITNNFDHENWLSDLDSLDKSLIHEFTFNNYFHNGSLSYVEQDLDSFSRVFIDLKEELIEDFGFDIEFLTDLYKFCENLVLQKGNDQFAFARTKEFKEIQKKINADDDSFEEYLSSFPEQVQQRFFDFSSCPPYDFLILYKDELYSQFSVERINKFLELFSCNGKEKDSFLFYTENNLLEKQPIIKISENAFIFFYLKQLPIAYYIFFYNFYKVKLGNERMQKLKARTLEEKCNNIFRDFLSKEKNTYIFQNYYIQDKIEQDLLVLSNGAAFIIEIKASSFREPLRDYNKAIIKIKDDFKETIQKGYDQCERVRRTFIKGEKFRIFDIKGNLLAIINPKKYYDVFSIIVTQERLGPIQQNLGYFLSKLEEDIYPYSIYINDLETFLRSLILKTKNPRFEFVTFLKNRELLHERLFSSDELDICAAYLSNKKLFLKLAKNLDSFLTMLPDNQNYFDDIYYQGIGLFKDELNIEEKRRRGFKPDKRKIKSFRYNI